MDKKTEAELLDRIAALESQVEALTPKPPQESEIARQVRELNECDRQMREKRLVAQLRANTIDTAEH
ncbi:hypothetical protein [Leptolyngbya sp. NIES-2104]|uniref:hypothetical protein n=1 Tax=Leptolyngbya sp. NIES-2104 TaxID=1552121 RepID=UPI0006EC4B1A|nr:hypothetical protein [Leptolyngbya sp. NIES-2104]GAP96090.1 hypothetical protein NIES2104_26250 [Leptolyngbya sp. NIES-2104]